MLATNRLRHGLVGLVVAGTLGLAACGGSTVTSDEVDATSEVAPLDRESSDAKSDSTSTAKKPKDSGSQSGGGSAPAPRDQGAQEIDEIPTVENDLSTEDEEYLAALEEEGIKIDELEDQLVSTAWTVCSDDAVATTTSAAVAGQLVEQGRTKLDEAAVVRLIESKAREIYCP